MHRQALFVMDPDGSGTAFNIGMADRLMVMPKGPNGDTQPAVVACFNHLDDGDGEGLMVPLVYCNTESRAEAVLASFVEKISIAQWALDKSVEESQERDRFFDTKGE